MKKLQARCQAGISYKDYSPALGDTLFEVNLFLESPEAKSKPELAKSIATVLRHYQMAGEVWQLRFSGNNGLIFYEEGKDKEIGDLILQAYPKAIEFKKTFPVRWEGRIRNYIDVGDVVNLAWKEASEELKKAVSMLSQSSK